MSEKIKKREIRKLSSRDSGWWEMGKCGGKNSDIDAGECALVKCVLYFMTETYP